MWRPTRLLCLLTLPALLGGVVGNAHAADQRSNGARVQSPTSAPLAATVLGEEVRTNDAEEMQAIVLGRLFDRYAEQQGIAVADAEIDDFVEHMRRGMRAEGLTAEDDLSPEEAAQAAQMRRDMGRAMIRQWKLNRALYRRYGGRIIFQQLGPEPLDAYRHYLEERQATGDFEIHDPAFKERFWRYFTDDSMHSFYEPGSAAEAQAFGTPPWERAAIGGEAFAARPDPMLEQAIREAAPDYTRAVVDITGREARYVYGRVDLNEDGRDEILVLLMGSIFCGTGGCDLLLFSDVEDGYSLIDRFVRGRLPVIASPARTAGWHELFLRESGGGAPPSYVRYRYDGRQYVEQERLPAEPVPEGIALLDRSHSYDTGFPLEPRRD